MDPKELKDWINEQRQEGYSFDDIRDVLAEENIPEEQIERAIESAREDDTSSKSDKTPKNRSNKRFWVKAGGVSAIIILAVLGTAFALSGPENVSIKQLSNSGDYVNQTVKVSGILSSSNAVSSSGNTLSFKSCQEKSDTIIGVMQGATGIGAFFSDSGRIPEPKVEITGEYKQSQMCDCEMKINSTEGVKWSSNTPYNVEKTLAKNQCESFAEKKRYVTSNQNNILPSQNFTVSDSRCSQTRTRSYLACEKFNWKNRDEIERRLKQRYREFEGKVLDYAAKQN